MKGEIKREMGKGGRQEEHEERREREKEGEGESVR